MPVMPPAVSTSQIRMSRVAPSACPLSQGSAAQGIRSIVTRMSRMVMSELADVIERLPLPAGSCLPDLGQGKVNHKTQALIQRLRQRVHARLRRAIGGP